MVIVPRSAFTTIKSSFNSTVVVVWVESPVSFSEFTSLVLSARLCYHLYYPVRI